MRRALLVLLGLACVYQALELRDVRTHYGFALRTLEETTFAAQQCEAVNAQCCR